jgi:hypothetical protein
VLPFFVFFSRVSTHHSIHLHDNGIFSAQDAGHAKPNAKDAPQRREIRGAPGQSAAFLWEANELDAFPPFEPAFITAAPNVVWFGETVIGKRHGVWLKQRRYGLR